MLTGILRSWAIITVLIDFIQTLFLRIGGNWGATTHERRKPRPGDDLVPDAARSLTLAVTIAAPPHFVWPWLMQMGVDRAGLYSLLWVENGMLRLGVKNADEIVPEWQDLKVGDIIAFTPEGYPGGRRGHVVTALEPNHHLVLCLGEDPENCPGTWQFVLEDQGDGTTRLLLRSRTPAGQPFGPCVFNAIMDPGYIIMDISMLRGIQARAERLAAGRSDAGGPIARLGSSPHGELPSTVGRYRFRNRATPGSG